MAHYNYEATKSIAQRLAKRIGDARAVRYRVRERRDAGYILFTIGGAIAARHGGSLGTVFSDWVTPYLPECLPSEKS